MSPDVAPAPLVDLRTRRGAGAPVAVFLLIVAAAVLASAVTLLVTGVWEGAVALLIAASMAWLALTVLRTRLLADAEAISVSQLLGTERVSWRAIGDLYLEFERTEPVGLLALSADQGVIRLTPNPLPGVALFDPDDLTDAYRALSEHLRASSQGAARPDQSNGIPESSSGSQPVEPFKSPEPIVYSQPGWLRSVVGMAVTLLCALGVTIACAVLVNPVTAIAFMAISVIPSFTSLLRDAPRPGGTLLKADDAGIAWYSRGERTVPWAEVVDVVSPCGKRNDVLLLTTRHEAHALPRPRGAEAGQVAADIASHRPRRSSASPT